MKQVLALKNEIEDIIKKVKVRLTQVMQTGKMPVMDKRLE